MVMARRGTYCSPKKSEAASRRVTLVERDQAVRLSRAGAGLVETDVAGAADAEELQIDPAGVANRFLVFLAEGGRPFRSGSVPSGMWMFFGRCRCDRTDARA